MQLLQKRIPAVAAVVLATTLVTPVRGEVDVIEAYTVTSGGGLTRDSLSDANLTQTRAPRTANHSTARRRRARTDPKDFVASRPHRHPREARQSGSRVAATSPTTKRRNPAASFVYWWNGWVIRTFHTKFGTVLLGTVGAKS